MEMFQSPDFWIAVGQIIMIDILLGGDNAVVIALACRSLPPQQRTKGIIWGTAGAIVLRVILIFFALQLLAIPYLKLVGAVLLVWIGVKLLLPEDEGGGHGDVAASDKLWGAVKTVIVADLVMSVDNVIAIAGAAEGAGGDHTMPLVIFGLLVSIPIIVWGSQLVLKLMDRFPIVITVGGMLLGWIAGTMAVTDPGILPWMPQDGPPGKPEVLDSVRYGAGVAGALLVLALGKWLASRRQAGAPPAEAAVAAAAGAAARHIRRVVLAVDGSPTAAAAVQRVLGLREDLRDGQALELHLVNVQRPLSEDVSRFIAGKTIEEHHRENSEQAFVAAREQLGPVAANAREHALVGAPGPTIAGLARELGADLIVLGARGLGASTAALLGSVAQSTIEQATVPVLVVK
jgi:YjbE family integral membrane protein